MRAPCLTFPPGWFDEALLGSFGRPFVAVAGVGTDAGGCRCFSPAPAVAVSIVTIPSGLRGELGCTRCGRHTCVRVARD